MRANQSQFGAINSFLLIFNYSINISYNAMCTSETYIANGQLYRD